MYNQDFITSILQDRPIAYRSDFSKVFKDISCGVFLSQLFYWIPKANDPDGVYKTQQEWFNETGLTRRNQETARKKLKNSGVLVESSKGIPRKIYYSVNYDLLYKLLDEYHANKNDQTRHTVEAQPAIQ